MRYTYDRQGRVLAELDASNQIKAEYVWGPDRLLFQKDKNGNVYYYVHNAHGDVIQLTDINGNLVNNYEYDEWGNILSQQEPVRNVFKYAGEIYDNETQYYYLRARYYDPSVGRFINKDTYEGDITNPLSLNLYTYVHNNPLRWIDPTGHWCTSADGKWSLPGGCNGGVSDTDVQRDVNGSKYMYDGACDGCDILRMDRRLVRISMTIPMIVLVQMNNLA